MKQKEREREEYIEPEEEPGTILLPEPEQQPEEEPQKNAS